MASINPIQFYNRYTQQIETEAIFGERWLRWAYGNPLGLLSTKVLISRKLISRGYGRKMNHPRSKNKILPFIEEYGLDVDEFEKTPEAFSSFNDFFTRKLKPDARPIDEDSSHVIFPADGRHLLVPELGKETRIFSKGQKWKLGQLLRDPDLAERFRGGSLLLSRLCPVDYHHFHFPIAGIPKRANLVKGPLYSVNPIALRQNLRFLMGNQRMITMIQDSLVGPVLFLEIGATMVGSIQQCYTADKPVVKGARKGYFEFGGSSVISIFPPDTIQFAPDLVDHSKAGIELYAKMGDFLGEIIAKEC